MLSLCISVWNFFFFNMIRKQFFINEYILYINVIADRKKECQKKYCNKFERNKCIATICKILTIYVLVFWKCDKLVERSKRFLPFNRNLHYKSLQKLQYLHMYIDPQQKWHYPIPVDRRVLVFWSLAMCTGLWILFMNIAIMLQS